MKYLNTKPGSIEEVAASMSKYAAESEYQDMFKKELEKAGKGIGSMTPAEKKAFFNKIDTKYKAKDEQVKNPYAIGMAAAMKAKDDQPPLKKSTITKAHDIAKSIEKDQKEELQKAKTPQEKIKTIIKMDKVKAQSKKIINDPEKSKEMAKKLADLNEKEKDQKEDYTNKDVDKFHKSLDKLVHKSFGHSSDEKKKEMKKEEKDIPKGYHKMPDGTIMKDSEHKKEEVKETHSFVTNKQNQKKKEVGGEKEPIITTKNEWKTFAMMAAELREKKEEKKELQAGEDTRDSKQKTMTGQVATSPEMNPKVDYKY